MCWLVCWNAPHWKEEFGSDEIESLGVVEGATKNARQMVQARMNENPKDFHYHTSCCFKLVNGDPDHKGCCRPCRLLVHHEGNCSIELPSGSEGELHSGCTFAECRREAEENDNAKRAKEVRGTRSGSLEIDISQWPKDFSCCSRGFLLRRRIRKTMTTTRMMTGR